MSKTKVFLVSFLSIPMQIVGGLVGMLLTAFMSWNRYEPLFDIYSLLEPFIMGLAAGYLSFYVIYKLIVKSNEHFFALITFPILSAVFGMFYDFFYMSEIYWQFYASTITSTISYIYFIKKAE